MPSGPEVNTGETEATAGRGRTVDGPPHHDKVTTAFSLGTGQACQPTPLPGRRWWRRREGGRWVPAATRRLTSQRVTVPVPDPYILNVLVGGLVWGSSGVLALVGGRDRRGCSSVVRVNRRDRAAGLSEGDLGGSRG